MPWPRCESETEINAAKSANSFTVGSLFAVALTLALFTYVNTKLGRIIQEQGRPQLKAFSAIGWGTPKEPYCRGFTPEEFQALDFSKMDLSEYYAEIEARAQSEIQIDMKDKIDAHMQTINN